MTWYTALWFLSLFPLVCILRWLQAPEDIATMVNHTVGTLGTSILLLQVATTWFRLPSEVARFLTGLEALQLLACLNLSNNQISSFTALEPLKLLSSLRVLDVSFNMIGAHAIDTTRYLCSSPLSHTLDAKQLNVGYEKENTEVRDHWEVTSLFRALRLTQLDIKGNAVLNEKFSVLAIELLPSLKWLDGKRVRWLQSDLKILWSYTFI